jgi:ribonucleoside-diphosphate reductase alpha chain
MDSIATLTSLSLQYGVPLEALVNKFGHVRFEPSGFTKNPDIPYAKSLTDYIFRFLGTRFLSTQQKQDIGLVETSEQQGLPANESDTQTPTSPNQAAAALNGTAAPTRAREAGSPTDVPGTLQVTTSRATTWQSQADAPSCADCGSIMIRNGSCYKCLNCGSTSGCS